MPRILSLSALLLGLVALAACDSSDPFVAERGELIVEDVIIGTGAEATLADTVRVTYTGRLLNGEVFDTSENSDTGFADFPLTGVIAGFRDGIVGMREGGQRRLEIPPHLGYGARSIRTAPDFVIPPNSTLRFEVELLTVNP